MLIAVCVLAVFGGYAILDMIRSRILYPMRVRNKIYAAVIFDGTDFTDAAAYAAFLRREKKISPRRLIILTKDDIMEEAVQPFTDCGAYYILRCKELTDDEQPDRSQKA